MDIVYLELRTQHRTLSHMHYSGGNGSAKGVKIGFWGGKESHCVYISTETHVQIEDVCRALKSHQMGVVNREKCLQRFLEGMTVIKHLRATALR